MSPLDLTLREFIERLHGQGLAPWQLEMLQALGLENTPTHEEDLQMRPFNPNDKTHPSARDRRQVTPPAPALNRYVYHIHGHAKLHDTLGDEGPVVPFEVVIRKASAIDSDEAMEGIRNDLRSHIQGEIGRQGSPYLVGDVMVRGVSFLHRILVDSDDPDGEAVKVCP